MRTAISLMILALFLLSAWTFLLPSPAFNGSSSLHVDSSGSEICLFSSEAFSSRNDISVDIYGGKDFLTIQAAIDAASSGDTIHVFSGTYDEDLKINKNLTIIGEGAATTIIDGDLSGNVVEISASWAHIRGFTVRNSGTYGSGIDIGPMDNGIIEDCIIAGNCYGICGDRGHCDDNTFNNNTLSNNSAAGIWISGDRNMISNNTCNNDPCGISLTGDDNIIKDNFCHDNSHGLYLGSLQDEVLLMGNSYTYTNDLDVLVEGLLQNAVPNAWTERLAGGGMTLADHATDASNPGTTWNKTLNGGRKWDWVFLQDQSQIPGFPTNDSYWQDSLQGAKILDAMIEKAGAQTVLLMTWGRMDGDLQNPDIYPDFLTMQSRLEKGYNNYSRNISAPGRPAYIAPAGLAFKHIYDEIAAGGGKPNATGTPFYDLYSPDGSHPSLAGSYLAACVIYSTLTGRSPVGLNDTTGLNGTYRLALQKAAAATVFNETPGYVYPWQGPARLIYATNNTLTNNVFLRNSQSAITVLEYDCAGNMIHHNDLYENGQGGAQSIDDGSGNAWDDGTQGNYWAEYPSRYPSASNNGMVWDTPYTLGGAAFVADRYPLLKPANGLDLTPPVANAGADITVAKGETVVFNSTGSTDDIGIMNFTWSFQYNGSGRSLYGPMPAFVFNITGIYNVTLKVRDAGGNSANDHVNVTVLLAQDTSPPMPPMGLDLNRTVDNGTLVAFEAGNWTDDMSFISNHTWTFYFNGSQQVLAGKNASFIFDIAGNYSVILNVTNSVNLSAFVYFWVLVLDDLNPPVAVAGPDVSIDQHMTVTFNGNGSYDDKAITNYTWTFSDLGVRVLYGIAPNYTFDNAGSFEVTLNVSDERGNWGSDSLTVAVNDITAPTIVLEENATILQGATMTFDAGNCSDNVGISEYRWDIFDVDNETLFVAITNHTFENAGVFNVILTLTDLSGNVASKTQNVTVIDTEPPRINYTVSQYVVYEGTVVVFDGRFCADNIGVVNWTWRMDNTTLYGPMVEHRFTKAFNYMVSLMVFDARGNYQSELILIVVKENETQPPIPQDDDTDDEQQDDDGPNNWMIYIVVIAIIVIISVIYQIYSSSKKKREHDKRMAEMERSSTEMFMQELRETEEARKKEAEKAAAEQAAVTGAVKEEPPEGPELEKITEQAPPETDMPADGMPDESPAADVGQPETPLAMGEPVPDDMADANSKN